MHRYKKAVPLFCSWAISWIAVFAVRAQFVDTPSIAYLLLLLFASLLALAQTVNAYYFLVGYVAWRNSRRQLELYPYVFKVTQLPSKNNIILLAANADVQIGDFGWQAESVANDDLVYLHGLDEDWNIVWYAGFRKGQLELMCQKPCNQYGRKSWQLDMEKCPYVVQSRVSSDRTWGLPLPLIGRWVQGVFVRRAFERTTQ